MTLWYNQNIDTASWQVLDDSFLSVLAPQTSASTDIIHAYGWNILTKRDPSLTSKPLLVNRSGVEYYDPLIESRPWLFPNYSTISIMECFGVTIVNADGNGRSFKLSSDDLRRLQTATIPEGARIGESFPAGDCDNRESYEDAINHLKSGSALFNYVQFTATADNGISKFYKTTQTDYDQLKEQFPNNISNAFPTQDKTGLESYIDVVDYLQTALPFPSPTPATNNLVIVQTACGSQRVVMTDDELQSFEMGNFLPAPAPSTLTYQISGRLSQQSTYNSFLQIAANCYNVPSPIPTGTKGGSLAGIVMFLSALGLMLGGRFGK